MAIYYIMPILLTAIGIPMCRKQSGEKLRKILVAAYLGIVFLVILIPAAIRNVSGYDYNLYAGWYYDILFKDYYWIMNWSREKGFAVPIKILSVVFSSDWQPMFVIIALVVAVGIVLYIYKNSNLAYVSVAAFFTLGTYYNSLNFMRQTIAAIIVTFALSYVASKQFLRFLVLVLLASCFHYSALIMIPFYFILRIRLNWITLGVYSAVGAAALIFSVQISGFITQYFYKGYDPMKSVHMVFGLPLNSFIAFVLPCIPIFMFRKALIRKRTLNSVLINAYFFAAYFSLVGVKHAVLARFGLLFMIAPMLALMPDLIIVINEKIKIKFEKNAARAKICSLAIAAVFASYALMTSGILLVNDNHGVVPYMTVFDKHESGS